MTEYEYTKKCTICNEIFPANLNFFHKQKNGLYNLRSTCKNCTNASRRLIHENNKEKENETNRMWYHNNKDKRAKKIEEYRHKNPEKVKSWQTNYNPTLQKKRKERRKTDIIFKLKTSVTNLIRASFKRTNTQKNNNTIKILNCTIEEFKIYIESKFEPWMNWDNYGVYNPKGKRTWNIDHIIPLASAETVDDVIKLNNYTNLRPLCSFENLIKFNKIIPEILPHNLL